MNILQFDFSGKKVLVTGGTGFIGGRLIEKLVLECHADVRVLARNFTNAFRIARFPLEFMYGELTAKGDVERAVSGCEVIFHCAYGNQGDHKSRKLVNIAGTKNVLEAALHAGVKRVVHLSTAAVYGWATTDGDLDETAPRRYSNDVYSDSKLEAEKIALHYAEKYRLPVVVIQPTVVYGPFSKAWTVAVIQQLKTGKVILVNDGEGLCNAVYVDDVVSAVLLAAVKKEAVGEVFLISGEQPVTWRSFYNRYERMLAISATVNMSPTEAKHYRRETKGILRETLSMLREEAHIRERLSRTAEVTYLKRIVSSLLSEHSWQSLKQRFMNGNGTDQQQVAREAEKIIHPVMPFLANFFASKTRVRIDKAKKLLSYQPAYDFESGMKLTEEWARWANLLEG